MVKDAKREDRHTLVRLGLKVWDDALLTDLSQEFDVKSQASHSNIFIKYVGVQAGMSVFESIMSKGAKVL